MLRLIHGLKNHNQHQEDNSVILKNLCIKIVICMAIISANAFCSQEEQNFTPETLMRQQENLKGKAVTFEGGRYKVTEDELHAYNKDCGNILSRWVTLKRSRACFCKHRKLI